MNKRVLIAVLVALAVGVVVIGFAQADSLLVVGELGCQDYAYKWYSTCDHTKGMNTTMSDHIVPSGGSWKFTFDWNPPLFKSVMVGTSEQHTSFDADLRGGAILSIFWTPGYSRCEQLEATLDGITLTGRLICAGSDNGLEDAQLGAPGDLWYFTEVFDFGPLTDGSHTLTIWSLDGDGVGFDYIKLEAVVVDIDIKPGSDPNCFNNDGHGVIPVAILSSDDLDVNDIDPASVSLEGLGVRMVGKKSPKYLAHYEDVSGPAGYPDGYIDLVVQIEDTDGTFAGGDTEATLTANLWDGTPIVGTDSICIVP